MSDTVTQYHDLQPGAFPEHSSDAWGPGVGSRPPQVPQVVEAVSHRERAACASRCLVRAPSA